jgi:hypothetical protein
MPSGFIYSIAIISTSSDYFIDRRHDLSSPVFQYGVEICYHYCGLLKRSFCYNVMSLGISPSGLEKPSQGHQIDLFPFLGE